MGKRSFLACVAALSVLASASCATSGKPVQSAAPLWEAGSDRVKIVVLSDIHFGVDGSYAEIRENLPYLIELLDRIAATKDVREVVLNGDVLDEWYLPLSYAETDRAAFYQKVLANNASVVEAFKRVMEAGVKLVYVVGNHDMSVDAKSVEAAIPGMVVMADTPGVGLYRTGDRGEIVIEHCHRYDAFSAPDTITNAHLTKGPTMLPPGYFYARYAAEWVISGKPSLTIDLPSLAAVPDRAANPDQFAAYAYYRTLSAVFGKLRLGRAFSEKVFDIRIDGYDGAYSLEDLFPVLNAKGEISAPLLYPNYQRTWAERQKANGVRVPSSFTESALGALDGRYFEGQARRQYGVDKAESETSVVLFGHTHVPAFFDYGNGHYFINTGTWIDHNTTYRDKDGSYFGRTFAVVSTGPSDTVAVYQYRTDGTLRDIKELLLADQVK